MTPGPTSSPFMHQSLYKDPLDEYSRAGVHQDVDWMDGGDGDNTLNQT